MATRGSFEPSPRCPLQRVVNWLSRIHEEQPIAGFQSALQHHPVLLGLACFRIPVRIAGQTRHLQIEGTHEGERGILPGLPPRRLPETG